jgi:hypothetical protein
VARDAKVVRWFVEVFGGRSFKASPLANMLSAYEASTPEDWATGASRKIESIDPARAHHYLHLVAHFARLAWSITALCALDSLEHVDGSFFADDLLGADNRQPDVDRKLPGGVGTLYLAAKFVQGGRATGSGGGLVWISGKAKQGYDFRWETPARDVVLVERKDRSYEAGLADTPEWRTSKVIDETRKAHIPREAGALRILAVGFQHLVRESEIETMDRSYQAALDRAFPRASRSPDLPNIVIVEHLGFEPVTGGEKSNFFTMQGLTLDRRLWKRVGPLVARGLGYS